MNTNPNIKLLIGNRIDDPGELRFIQRLREDLVHRGMSAVLAANFFTPRRRHQRQVDLLIFGERRLMQVEIKHLDQDCQLLGGVNGRWRRRHPDGTEEDLDKNFYSQARDATFAISDEMKKLAREQRVPAATFKQIDTVVCVFPDIPAGSELEAADHVLAIGYPDLLDRLDTTGPRPAWDDKNWDEFVRHLRLYDANDETPTQQKQRAQAKDVSDYARRAVASLEVGAPHGVDLCCVLDGDQASQDMIAGYLRAGRSVALYGGSGVGKSHLARRTAIQLLRNGELVIWLDAGDFDDGDLSRSLRRAVAPYSTTHVMQLIRGAQANGIGIVLVVDGLNDCRALEQRDLLEKLAAFGLRYPCGALITAQDGPGLPARVGDLTARMADITTSDRLAILTAHGAKHPEIVTDTFITPQELAIAARCASLLPADATVTDLYDSYTRSLVGSEVERSGLRGIAVHLHSALRSSGSLRAVSAHLGSASGLNLDPEVVDDVLANALLEVNQGRVRFCHEVFLNFFVAEHFARTSVTGDDLAARLGEPAAKSLTEQALALVPRPADLQAALAALADSNMYLAAVDGKFGTAAAIQVRGEIASVIAEAAAATEPDAIDIVPDEPIGGIWRMRRSWSPAERAMLTVAGYMLHRGELVDEIAALLERTDDIFSTLARDAAAAGLTFPVNELVASTYMPTAQLGDRCLPVTLVAEGCRILGSFHSRTLGGGGTASRLLDVPEPRWGRCVLAAHTFDPSSPTDRAVLPALIQSGLQLRGYHLELEVLGVIERSGRSLNREQRSKISALLEGYHPNHIFLSSSLVEALAALGEVEPLNSFADLREQIAAILASPRDPLAPGAARGIVSSQWDNEEIVGPACAAIDSLERLDRVRLLLIAAAYDEIPEYPVWTIEQLVAEAPTDDAAIDADMLAVFQRHAREVDTTGPMLQANVEHHLRGIQGLAKLDAKLPPVVRGLTDDERAWRLVDELVLQLDRPEEAASDDVWDSLLQEVPAATPDVLLWIRHGEFVVDGESVHHQLVRLYPDQLRQLFEWSLSRRHLLTSQFGNRPFWDRDEYLISILGAVGSSATASQLEAYAIDPALGESAVRAIKHIHDRHGE